MKLILSDAAHADLANIASWIAEDSPRSAVAVVTEIKERCARITQVPLAYPLLRRHEGSRIRRAVQGSY